MQNFFTVQSIAIALSFTSCEFFPGATIDGKGFDESQSTLEVVPSVTSLASTGVALVRYCLKDKNGDAFADDGRTVSFGTDSGTSTGTFSTVTYNDVDHCYESNFTADDPGTPVDVVVTMDASPLPVTHSLEVTAPRLSFTNNSRPTVTVEDRVFTEGAADWNLTGNCDPFLGAVRISGGINAETTTVCQSDGTFSVTIDTSSTDAPYFVAQGDPLIQVTQGALEPISTRLYMTPVAWTNVFISTRAELQAMQVGNSQRTRNYFLKNDIDLSLFAATNNFSPLGNDVTNYWSGRLYGDGRRIQNLHIDGGGGQYRGLLGYATGHAQIFDLHFDNAVITNSATSGALAGMFRNTEARARRVSVQGSISGPGGNGLIIGQMWESRLFDSWSSGTVVASNVGGGGGGVIGILRGGWVYDTWSDATVTGDIQVGGLIGEAFGGFRIFIERSFATGSVTAATEGAGGLAGSVTIPSIDIRIIDSFALGSVTGSLAYSCLPSGPFLGILKTSTCTESTSTAATNNLYLSSAVCTDCSPQFTRALPQNLTTILTTIQTSWDFDWKWKLNSLGTRPELIANPGSPD